MFIGTFFTLFVVPSIYMLIARDHGKDRKRDAGTAPEGSPIKNAVSVSE